VGRAKKRTKEFERRRRKRRRRERIREKRREEKGRKFLGNITYHKLHAAFVVWCGAWPIEVA
jgi:hypothetical protein